MEKFCMFPSFLGHNCQREGQNVAEENVVENVQEKAKTPQNAQKPTVLAQNEGESEGDGARNSSPEAMLKILSAHSSAHERIMAKRR